MGAAGSTLQEDKGDKYTEAGGTEVIISPNISAKVRTTSRNVSQDAYEDDNDGGDDVDIREYEFREEKKQAKHERNENENERKDKEDNTSTSSEPKKKRRSSFEDNMNLFNTYVNKKDQNNLHIPYKEIKDEHVRQESKRIIVEGFLEQQVALISERVVNSKPSEYQLKPSLSYSAFETENVEAEPHPVESGFLSKSLKYANGLPSTHSSLTLRGMAKRHHARQRNAYINANTLGQVSTFLHSFSNKQSQHGSGESLISKKSSVHSLGSKGSMKLDKIEEKMDTPEKKGISGIALPPKLEIVPAAAPPVNNMKKKMGLNLNLKIQVNDDEDDWIQVSKINYLIVF